MNSAWLIALMLLGGSDGSESFEVCVAHFPPMIYVDESGQVSGSDFDMFELLAADHGFRQNEDYTYRVVPSFQLLVQEARNGTCVSGMAGVSITVDRLQDMDFTQPYKNSGQRIMVLADDSATNLSFIDKFWRPDIGIALLAFVVNFVIWGFFYWAAERRKKEKANIKTFEDGVDTAMDTGSTVGFGRFFPLTRIGKYIVYMGCFLSTALLNGNLFATLTTNQVIEQTNSITGPESLKGKIVAGVKGTTGAKLIEHEYNPSRLLHCDSFRDAVVEMRLGNADAVVADDPVVLNYVNENPGIASVAGNMFHPEHYGIMFASGNEALARSFSVSIAKLRESGKLDMISQKWFGE